jgi:cytochrome c oxidase subunit 1
MGVGAGSEGRGSFASANDARPRPDEAPAEDEARGASVGSKVMLRGRGWLATDHRTIGLRYLGLALLAVVDGTLMSLAMRVHLVWPDLLVPGFGLVKSEDYLKLVTLHGTLMLFFVVILATQSGFGNLILPAQIGARRMAFPWLNAMGFWVTAVALGVLIASGFVEGGAAISGWTAYPPLSAVASAGPGQGLGMDLWLLSIALYGLGGIANAVNTLATIVAYRCEGMDWDRLPLTVWAWFTGAMLILIAFGVLFAALVLLFCDRHAGTSFFLPAGDLVNGTLVAAGRGGSGSPMLWLHLFWFFGHPAVYIAILPGMGLTSMILANFARRRVFGYRMMITTTLLIGALGILVWGHHMFVAGLNPFASSAFSVSTMAIAIPSIAKVLSWLATVWRSRPRYSVPMLFALGFVSLFVAGGLTGPILAQPVLDEYLNNTYFVVAHFHLIMAMAGVFGLFAATYYWFPLMCGRMMNERLGKWHFWLSIVGAYATFLPMHIAGLMGAPRHYAQFSGMNAAAASLLSRSMGMQRHVTDSAFLLAGAQMLFLVNLVVSWRKGRMAEENPWEAMTMEWMPGAFWMRSETVGSGEGQSASNQKIRAFRGPCDYAQSEAGVEFKAQWVEFKKPE